MRSEALDITIESRGSTVWLSLAGPFHNEQIPNIREKMLGLVRDDNRSIVVDLEHLSEIGDAVAAMFLSVLNTLRGKGGEIKLIFKNEAVSHAFAPYRNLFTVYPDARSAEDTFSSRLRRRVRLWSRKTGVRMSRPVALFLLITLCGWFLSLAFILHLQNRRIHEQEQELQELATWKQKTMIEVDLLRERLRPMEQLGLVSDSSDLNEEDGRE